MCCSELQCVAVCCSVLQCAAASCSVMQCVEGKQHQEIMRHQCVAVSCSVLQCVAVCCSVLQQVVLSFDVSQITPHIRKRGGGLGSSTIFKNLMSPTPRRKWYLTTGRRAH